jgi:hypothetical protein
MSKGGISLSRYVFPTVNIPTLVDPKQAKRVLQEFAKPADKGGEASGGSATPAAPQASCGTATDPFLTDVWAAVHSAVKAALIAAHVARNYPESHLPPCPVPEPDVQPKPPLVNNPPCQPPVLAEKRYVGDELVRQLDAGGAAIGESNGAYGVQSGRCGDLSSEIDPGEWLAFHVPNGGRAASGKVTIDKLFNAGPDGNRQEQGILEVYDNGRLVKTIEFRGYSASNGQQTVEIDVPFTMLVFKAKGESKGYGVGSDFAVRDITVRTSTDAPAIQPLPQPYPLPNPDQPPPYIGIPRFGSDVIQPLPQPYPLPKPDQSPPYIGIPRFGSDVIVGPVHPPVLPRDPFPPAVARSLARLAEIIDRSRLPESVQNALLDRIATILSELKPAPSYGGPHGTTLLIGIASLIATLENSVPHHVSRKLGHGGKEHVMHHLKTLLFSAALGRGDVLHAPSKVA